MVVRAAASLAGGYMAVSLKDRPVDRGQQDSRLQRYATIVAQLSAQRMHTSAQCFIWASSPMRSHDCAHLRQTSAQRSEEHTSELQSLMRISYAVFCLKKKKTTRNNKTYHEAHLTPNDKRTNIITATKTQTLSS